MLANLNSLQHNKIIVMKTKLMVTNPVHLQTEITEPYVTEVFFRVRLSHNAELGPRQGKKPRERYNGRRIRLFFISVITFYSSTASVTNFSAQFSRRSNVKFCSRVCFSFLSPTF